MMQGFPIVFNHMSPSRIMIALKAAKVAKDIMEARGDHLCFGLMVRAGVLLVLGSCFTRAGSDYNN